MNLLAKRYLSLLWAQKGLALLGVLLAVVTALSGVALLAVSGWFISAAALAGVSVVTAHAFNFFAPGAIVRGLSISRTAGRYGERIITHEATFRLLSRLRADLFRVLAARKWSEQKFNRHDVASRMLEDIRYVESIYLSAAVPAVTAIIIAFGYLGVLAMTHASLALLASGFVVLLLLFLPWLYSRAVLIPQDELHRQRSQQWSTASGILHALRTLTLFGQFEHYSEAFIRQTRNTDQLEARAVARQQGVLLAAQVALALLTLALFWQAFSLYSVAELGGAQLFMVLLLTLGVAEVLLAHIPAVANFRLGWRALNRLDQMAGGENTPDPRQFIRGERPAVMLNNVSYRYPAQKAATLTEMTHKLTPGWHWLVGESGAGKSTLIGLLAGDLTASQGEVILAGATDSVAVMPQQVAILRASLRQNVALHRTSSDKAIERALEQVGLSEWIETLPQGLDTWLGEGEWQPSGGEAKRIGLARLLVEESKIILLDEPFAGLDAQRIDQLMINLRKAWQGKVVIAVSHDHQYIDAQDSTLALRPHPMR